MMRCSCELRVMLCGWRWKSYRRASWPRRDGDRCAVVKRLARDRFVSSPATLQRRLSSRASWNLGVTGCRSTGSCNRPCNRSCGSHQYGGVPSCGPERRQSKCLAIKSASTRHDTTLDASDVLLGTANTGQLNAGQSKNVTTNLTIPNSLDALTYRLLAKLSITPIRSAGTARANNLAVGGTINVKWQFGTVPGRSGSMTLTLKDADGTTVVWTLRTGLGRSDQRQGELGSEGDPRHGEFSHHHYDQQRRQWPGYAQRHPCLWSALHLLAATTDLTGTMAIDGPVNIPGAAPGNLTLGSIQRWNGCGTVGQALTIPRPSAMPSSHQARRLDKTASRAERCRCRYLWSGNDPASSP